METPLKIGGINNLNLFFNNTFNNNLKKKDDKLKNNKNNSKKSFNDILIEALKGDF